MIKLFKRGKDADDNDVILDASSTDITDFIKDSEEFKPLREEITESVRTELAESNKTYLAEKEKELNDNFLAQLADKDVKTITVNGIEVALSNLNK